jgi:Fe-S-cluster-containing dehydrogenase component
VPTEHGPSSESDATFECAFRASLLRALDARGRADVRAAARVRRLAAGDVVFSAGEPADTLFAVARGAVALYGSDAAAEAVESELFGRDALVPGARRSGQAIAREPAVVLEFPLSSLRRALTRAGAPELLVREENAARRRAWFALVRTTAFGRELDERTFDSLAAAWQEQTFVRGERWLERGEVRDSCWIVVRGLVELSDPAEHAASGDWVGVSAVLAFQEHDRGAVALAEVTALRVPGPRLRVFAAEAPRAFGVLQEQAKLRAERQLRLRDVAKRGATRHAFDEIQRLESATSLLAIDLESCVRCGECSVACADTHGSARFDRTGPKVRVHLRLPGGGVEARALILPNACQHCHEPTCLPECPTGAITRSASGSVLIRAELCTGCGACAKACGYDAIRLEPTQATVGRAGVAAMVAEKCDLCREHSAPACVSACPTGAVARLSPRHDVVEVSAPGPAPSRLVVASGRRSFRKLLWWFLLPPLLALARLGATPIVDRLQLVSGVLAGVLCLLLVAHTLLKRLARVRAYVQQHLTGGGQRGLSPLVRWHAVAGAALVALVLLHAGVSIPEGAAGALVIVFYLSCLSGGFGAIVYRVLPARLTRWERHHAPVEDRARERDELRQRWFDGSSARNEAVKELTRRVLLPYVTAPLGPLSLVISGRTLGAEVALLERRVEGLLAGRKSERLADSRALIETAVALRALEARRYVEGLLVAWVPCHLLLAVTMMVLLLAHVIGVLW